MIQNVNKQNFSSQKSFFANLALPCPRITAKDFFYVNIEYSFLWFPP